jgi:hypothetical protein
MIIPIAEKKFERMELRVIQYSNFPMPRMSTSYTKRRWEINVFTMTLNPLKDMEFTA